MPICITVEPTSNTEPSLLTAQVAAWINSGGALPKNLRIGERWPKPPRPEVPDGLPEVVSKAFLQGEKNFALKDCEDASATMYRRSLDLALKLRFPDAKGDLRPKITALVKDHELPATIGDWAHQVRIIGNDGAHELEGVTREDLIAGRGFVDAVLRYLFTFPGMVAERRAHQALTPGPASGPGED